VEDFEKAKRFLEALGYQKLVYYEKYRTTYEWNETLIMLDELPYGNFVEIEGETVDAIRAAAGQFHLNWETTIGTSYHALFERARKALNLSIQDLSFAEFKNIKVESSHLRVQSADA
jgi:adenylate cyclase class 2